MATDDSTAADASNRDRDSQRLLWAFVAAATLLGAAHHVDHVVRGNHVGWPVTDEVTLFTYSLAIYPLLAFGAYRAHRGRSTTRYWAVLLGASAVLLAVVHVGPWATEPPADVVGPYDQVLVGYAALAGLSGLVTSAALGGAYATLLLYRRRK